MVYPKLRYPIHTKGLIAEERLILLAYDIAWRAKANISHTNQISFADGDLDHDLDANLSNLGSYIETYICGGDLSLRFDGYDGLTTKDMKDNFKEVVENELNKGEYAHNTKET